MDKHTLKVLEYDRVKEVLASFTKTGAGKKKVKSINPETDYKIIERELKKVTELKNIIRIKGNLPFEELKENACLNKIDKSSYLLPLDILYIQSILIISKDLKDYFNSLPNNEYPHICSLWKGLDPLYDLNEKILNTIDEQGEVLDSAYPKLARIRRNILTVHSEIKKQLTDLFFSKDSSNFIQDNIITIRNRRFVVPVKQEKKKDIPGIIQDESLSRATLFIEPFEIVEKNNNLQGLFIEEKNEIENILCELTGKIREKQEKIVNNYNIIIALDIINAKARLSFELNGREPELNSCGKIKIFGGKHPLLLLNKDYKVVPISISVGDNFNVLVLSGANAGGKTAALKLAGLAVLLTQSGIHFPCEEGTTIGVFEEIWALIGDEQSLINNLSTFSSHILYIKQILNSISSNSLVLIDEICADTDPEEGAHLGFSIIKYLGEKKSRVIVTTHFNYLKMLVLTQEGMINASVEFDKNSFLPTYNIIMGSAGESMTLSLAERLGLPGTIVNEAKNINSQKKNYFESLVITQNALEDEKNKLEKERERLSLITKTHEEKLALLQQEIDNYQNKYHKEFKSTVREMKQKLQNTIFMISDKSKRASFSEISRNFNQIVDEFDNKVKKDLPEGVEYKKQGLDFEKINIGDRIKILDSNQTGEVIEKDEKRGTIKVNIKNIRLIVSPSNLEKIPESEIKQKDNSCVYVSQEEDIQIKNLK
ncbi:MAG: hypothetical protein HY934_09520 [Candidatus Firestonebacteria bacterium]|nr:hypothetical protein [Candidatus Firestonebacteria bacterium]